MPERFPRDLLLSLFSVALVAACGTSASTLLATDGGGSGVRDGAGGADGYAGDAGGLDGTSAEAEALDVAAEGDPGCPSDPPPPPTVPSVGTVTFVVTNTSVADRYVLTHGQLCDPFAIAGEQLSVPFQCVCECALPKPTLTLTTVAPGQSVSLTWDGRHVAMYTTHTSCCPVGSPASCGVPVTCATGSGGSAQPVPPGPLTVTIAYATQVTPGNAPGCGATTGGFMCNPPLGTSSNTQCGTGGDPPIQFVTQNFTLPASGGVTVQVSIP